MTDDDRKPGNFVKTGPARGDDPGDAAVKEGSQPSTGTTESTPRGMGSAKAMAFDAGRFAFKRALPA